MRPLHVLAELLAPHRCPRCAARAAPPWCGPCGVDARAVDPHDACPRCGLAGGDATDGHGCWPDLRPLERSVAVFAYRPPVADAIVAAKAGGAGSLWPALGSSLAEGLVRAEVRADLVVPVPTDPRRRRLRGVDHTAALAREVGRGLTVPVAAVLAVSRGMPDQGERAPEARWAVPLAAFRPRRRLPPVRVLLVDDVLTTGGTVWAAAGALRRAGAEEVVVGVLARAGRHPLGGVGARPRSATSTARG